MPILQKKVFLTQMQAEQPMFDTLNPPKQKNNASINALINALINAEPLFGRLDRN